MRAILLATAVLAGCTMGEDPSPQCVELESKLASCGERSVASFCESADPDEVDAALENACRPLGGNDDPEPADGAIRSRREGQWCLLSSQCEDGLVCRSALSFANQCLPPGQLGEHCWVSSHCEDGLSCHWIANHEIPGTPTHPGRVCNPHSTADHGHQLDGN